MSSGGTSWFEKIRMGLRIRLPALVTRRPWWRRLIEWRAGRIADPIQRLKFLRTVEKRRAYGWELSFPHSLLARAAVLVILVFLVPFHTVSDARASLEKILRATFTHDDPAERLANVWLVESGKGQ